MTSLLEVVGTAIEVAVFAALFAWCAFSIVATARSRRPPR